MKYYKELSFKIWAFPYSYGMNWYFHTCTYLKFRVYAKINNSLPQMRTKLAHPLLYIISSAEKSLFYTFPYIAI